MLRCTPLLLIGLFLLCGAALRGEALRGAALRGEALRGAAFCETARAQGPSLDHPVTLSQTHTDLATVVKELGRQTGFTFSYDPGELSKVKLDDIHWSNVPLKKCLSVLQSRTGLDYAVSGTTIALRMGARPKPEVPVRKGGSLQGRVVDFETTQPLPLATVRLNGRTVETDEKGYYHFGEVSEGAYDLTVTYTGYQVFQQQGIVVKGEKVVDVKLQAAAATSEVVIAAGARKLKAVTHSTDKFLLGEIRNAAAVVSGISSEQISRTADRNGADVVKRISGVTVVDEQFIIVRGMNERYNVTYLNGNIAPSTDLYTKAFSYDLLPSSVIDQILLYKSPIADLTAEYAGAAAKIFTKNALPVRHLDIGIQLAHRPGSTMTQINSYTGGKYDFLGFDDGTRKLPGFSPGYFQTSSSAGSISQAKMVQSFSPTLDYGHKQSTPDMQAYFNYYNAWRLGRLRLYDLTSVTYTKETRNYAVYHQTGNTYAFPNVTVNNGSADVIENEQQSTEIAKINVLQNLTAKWGAHHSIQFNNLFVNDGRVFTGVYDKQSNVAPYWDSTDAQFAPRKREIILSFQQRTLYSGNLGGQHKGLGGYRGAAGRAGTLDWNLGYTFDRLNVPDQRISHFNTNGAITDHSAEPAALVYTAAGTNTGDYDDAFLGMITRLFIDTRENVYNASADYALPLSPSFSLKTGTYQLYRTREVGRRFFRVNRGGLPPGDIQIPSSNEFGWPNGYGLSNINIIQFRQQQLGSIWNPVNFPEDHTGLELYDATSPIDKYVASEQTNAFYLMEDWKIARQKITINGGVRMEYDRQRLTGAINYQGIINSIVVNRPVTSWLPSVNLGYRPDSVFVLRAAYGRSVNRPYFQELTPYNDFDFLNNEYIAGNPSLQSATIDNADIRLEWYPRSAQQNEVFQVGAFYKYLKDPIERFRWETTITGSFSNFTEITFMNAAHAFVYGAEAEVRKNVLRNLSFVMNGTLIKSQATEYNEYQTGNVSNPKPVKGRALQGQAPYVFNAGLFYERAAWGTKIGLVYNVSGPIIYAKSIVNPNLDSAASMIADFHPDIVELPRHLVDLAFTQRLVSSLQMKLNIQNLLDAPFTQIEDHYYNQRYDRERPVHILVNGHPVVYYKGDNIYNKYYPGRYYVVSFTYAF